jgi:hypothetical protein
MSDILNDICQCNPPKLENCPCFACCCERLRAERDRFKALAEGCRERILEIDAEAHMPNPSILIIQAACRDALRIFDAGKP